MSDLKNRADEAFSVKVIDPISDKRWDDFINEHPRSTIFHSSAWAQVLGDRYKHDPTYYILENAHGEILAAAPFFHIQTPLKGRRLTCLPCSEYCFPLAYNDEGVGRLLSAAKAEVQSGRASYLEIRGWGALIDPEKLDLKEYPYYVTHVTGLDDDPERLRAKLDRGDYHLKRNLKLAEKSGVTVREAQNEDDLKKFYRLTVITRMRLKFLPWPYRFFQVIHRHIVMPGHGFLLLAELNDKLIAGSMYFRFRDTVTLKFNASDKKYSQFRPNYLLTWKAMEDACKNGYKNFDFGISNYDNLGLVAFKRQWGSEETTFPYYYYLATRGISSLPQTTLQYRRAHTTVNRWTPEFALKLMARVLYRHLE